MEMDVWHKGRTVCERSGNSIIKICIIIIIYWGVSHGLQSIWYHIATDKDLYNIDIQKQIAVHMWGFDGIQRGNYFGREPSRRAEVEVRVGTLMNGKGTGKDEITQEIIKSGGDRVVD